MGCYMVTLTLDLFDDQFWDLLPAHRKLINDLLVEGVVEMYSISEDRRQGWIVFHADSEKQVTGMVDNFPIRDYFSYEISSLFILNNSVSLWPKVHLN
jgi:hypothetical protein